MDRESILATNTIKSETVPVPEWGGSVIVRSMTSAEQVAWRDECNAMKKDGIGTHRFGSMLLIRSLLDFETGEQIFKPEDAARLDNQDGGLIDRLCGVANRLNGFNQKADDAAKKD